MIQAMLPKVDLSDVADEIRRIGEEIQSVHDDSEDPVEPAPQVLLLGLKELLETLRATNGETSAESEQALRAATGSEPDALLEHGLELLHQLAALARRLGLGPQAQSIDVLAVPFSCWMLRRGAELQHPEDVVNALAILANRLRQPEDLIGLYGMMDEIAEGIAADRIQDMDPTNPADPWLVLLINRGIVATRTYQPALMQEAFDAIVEQAPDHAPLFFREGMGQMEALQYPPHVREVMQGYYDRWCSGQRLH
jgi:hypothetical protein